MKEAIEKLTLKHRRPNIYKLLTELGCEYIGVEEVPLEKIMIDQGIYPREKTDKERISLYALNILNGDVFPPILTSLDYTKLDGNHRYYAHKEAEVPTIWIEKWDVPENLYPIVAQAVNTEEGNIDTPLTPSEKKKAILRDWGILAHIPKTERKKVIAQVLKTTVAYVDKVLSDAGIAKSEKEELKKKAQELKEQGYTYQQIADELGLSLRTIKYWLSEKVQKFTQVKNCTLSTTSDWLSENLPGKKSDNHEEDNIDWDATGWAEEEETKEIEEQTEKPKPKKEKEKKLLHPNQILERDKNIIWDAIIEIEFHFGEDKAEEVLEEIYFAYKERKHKGLTIYKDRRARYEAYERQ